MGFLSNIRNRVKKQIQPSIGSIRTPDNFVPPPPMDLDRIMRGPGLNPRKKITKYVDYPQDKIRSSFPPRPNRPTLELLLGRGPGIKRVEKRGGLANLLRRLQEQLRNQQMPQPIPERMPVNNVPSFNPTIFGQPIGDMDFSQMPKISPEDMMNLQIPTQMPMTQDLPEVAPVGMMPQMRMGGMQDMEPRMMMQEGEDVSLERELFSLQAQLKNLEEQLRLDRSYNDDQAVIDTSAKMAAMQKRIQEIMEGRPQLKDGGDFPDLTGDGKVTQADILKGRGVYAEGDEVMMMEESEMMAPGGDEIEASLMEVQDIQPEMQALDQYVQMVIEMVQAGASEAEVIESLRQAGLDDDDIEALFQAVMETLQSNMEQGGIDAELAQLS